MTRSLGSWVLAVSAATTPALAAKPSVTLGAWTDRQPFLASSKATVHYYLFSPKDVPAGRKLPLVLWLHGGLRSNGRGGPNLPMAAFYRDQHQRKWPCFVLRPVAVKGRNWVSPRGCGIGSHQMPPEPSPSVAALMELLDKTLAAHPVDANSLHVTGASMGGYGTWDVIQRHPKRFASAVPICGGGDPSRAAAIGQMRIWIFHSADDRVVPVRGSREMYAALTKAAKHQPTKQDDPEKALLATKDSQLRYTEFKHGGHNAWDRALGDPKVIEWVFSQNRTSGTRREVGTAH